MADLLLGFRIAVAGGREGWVRTGLTAVGVGLGVALLLLAAAIPHVIAAQQERNEARSDNPSLEASEAGEGTVLMLRSESQYQDDNVRGRVIQPVGDPAQAPVPPGLDGQLPGPGETLVSPALQDRLEADPDGLLAERVPGEIAGTIEAEGLSHGGELAFYTGVDSLGPDDRGVLVLDSFGESGDSSELDAILVLAVVAVCAILLLPVGVFVATAVRLGGQRRDERLAALRLLGTDAPMTRRIAAGEALLGALVGLLVGALLFVVGRQLLGSVTVLGLRFHPADVVPDPLVTAVIVLGVPAAAVLITLQAMRRVTVEPLGVARTAAVRRRRLWWRLLLPAVGLALLLPSVTDSVDQGDGTVATAQIAAGIVLVLVGVTAVLPWLVEWAVRRMRGGPVSVQLATRRLQQDSGPPSRAISGITVAVAGAIAIQMFLSGIEGQYRYPDEAERGGEVSTQHTTSGLDQANTYLADLSEVEGVTDSRGYADVWVAEPGADGLYTIQVGDCSALAAYADTTLDGCGDGDLFYLPPTDSEWDGIDFAPGRQLDLNPPRDPDSSESAAEGDEADNGPVLWTVPQDAQEVERDHVDEEVHAGASLLVTPGALTDEVRGVLAHRDVWVEGEVWLDPDDPDAIERVRNLAYQENLGAWINDHTEDLVDTEFAAVERGLYGGALAVLLLTAASLVVSTVEQLRERRRLLSVLVAYGTPRGVLARSVLWQTLLPVMGGVALAAAGGIGLGAVLQSMAGEDVAVQWSAVAGFGAAGAAVILLATLVSMPVLWRMMRPAGLRSE